MGSMSELPTKYYTNMPDGIEREITKEEYEAYESHEKEWPEDDTIGKGCLGKYSLGKSVDHSKCKGCNVCRNSAFHKKKVA